MENNLCLILSNRNSKTLPKSLYIMNENKLLVCISDVNTVFLSTLNGNIRNFINFFVVVFL